MRISFNFHMTMIYWFIIVWKIRIHVLLLLNNFIYLDNCIRIIVLLMKILTKIMWIYLNSLFQIIQVIQNLNSFVSYEHNQSTQLNTFFNEIMMIKSIVYINEMHGFIFLQNDHRIYCPLNIICDKNNEYLWINLKIGFWKIF